MSTDTARRRAAMYVLHTSLLIKAHLEEALRAELGLLLSDMQALTHLRGGPQRMTDIAVGLVLSPGGTTKVVDRLEELGYVARTPDPEDGRASVVDLTAPGRRALERAETVVDEGLDEMWSQHISHDEAAALVDLMTRVLGASRHR